MKTRYIILDEAGIYGSRIVRDEEGHVKKFESWDEANEYASNFSGCWSIIRQELNLGIWMSTNIRQQK